MPERVGHFDSADPRQADVEKNNVRMKVSNFLDRVLAVAGFFNDFDTAMARKNGANVMPGQLMIINDQDVDALRVDRCLMGGTM